MSRQKPSADVSVKLKISPWFLSTPFILALALVLALDLLKGESLSYEVERSPLPAEEWLANKDIEEAKVISYLRTHIHKLRQKSSLSSSEESLLKSYSESLILYETIEDHRNRIAYFHNDSTRPVDSLENEIILLYQQLATNNLLIEL